MTSRGLWLFLGCARFSRCSEITAYTYICPSQVQVSTLICPGVCWSYQQPCGTNSSNESFLSWVIELSDERHPWHLPPLWSIYIYIYIYISVCVCVCVCVCVLCYIQLCLINTWTQSRTYTFVSEFRLELFVRGQFSGSSISLWEAKYLNIQLHKCDIQ